MNNNFVRQNPQEARCESGAAVYLDASLGVRPLFKADIGNEWIN